MKLPPAERHALRAIAELDREVPCVLVGGVALVCQTEFSWRNTVDVDITIAADVDGAGRILRTRGAWKQDARVEHKWWTPEGVPVDVVPASRELLDAGEVTWPGTGARMSLLGLRHAFTERVLVDVDGLLVPVAPPPVIALLKMVAWLDSPGDRERDLADLAHLLDAWLAADDERRFDAIALDPTLTWETSAAFTLGHAMAGKLDARERVVVGKFLAIVRDDTHPSGAQARMLRSAPAGWRDDPEQLLLRLAVYEQGVDTRPPSSG